MITLDAPDSSTQLSATTAPAAVTGTVPLVSILIPAYKPRWFEQALQSALKQTYPNVEILVFDNCPSEAIRDIAARYPQARYWRNTNTGPRNLEDLAVASRGRYVKYLLDDDLLEPTCIAELLAAITREPGTQLAFGASWTVDENGHRLGLRQKVETPDRVHLYDGSGICRTFARDCANMIGEFSSVLFDGLWLREDPQRLSHGQATGRHFPGLGDVISFMNAAAGHPVAFVNVPLTSFRFNSESNSNPDKNPGYALAVTDWRAVIDEAGTLGVLSTDDEAVARNSYNNLIARLTGCFPALIPAVAGSRFPEDELPGYAYYLRSQELVAASRHQEARAILLDLAENDTCLWQVYDQLADHADAQGDEALALTYYASAARKAVLPIPGNLKHAALLRRAGRGDEAKPLLERFLDAYPDNTKARRLLAACEGRLTALRAGSAAMLSTLAAEHYRRWQTRRRTGGADEACHSDRIAGAWPTPLLVEFMLVLAPGAEASLADSIDSLAAQQYDGWRLSIFAETPSPDDAFTCEESPVRWIQVRTGASVADAVDERIAGSPASWVADYPCGTSFAPDLLLAVGDAVVAHPDWRLIYTDDEVAGAEGASPEPRFKPDFNLELMRATDYIGGILVEKATLLSIGGFSRLADAATYDLALRIADACGDGAIGHIADVLCCYPTNTRFRPDPADAMQAVADHLDRRGIDADVSPGLIDGVVWRVLYRHTTTPKVSVVVPTRNRLDLLGHCIESLLKHTHYPDWELLLVDNGSDDANTLAYYGTLCEALPERVRLLHYDAPFNFSAMNNLAAREARGDYLLLLNNDTECIHDDWLDAMMAHAQRPDVGIVGARLLFPDSLKIQHAGVILGMTGAAGHPFLNSLAHDEPGYLNRAQVDQEFSAVTGACLLIRKSIYEEVGGLDEQAFRISFNDIDLCLKVRQHGYRIIWTPFATLLHHGSATQITDAQNPQKIAAFQQECNQFYLRWTKEIADDPAWNRNLSLCSTVPAIEDELAVPWNTDFHDRPRILVIPVSSPGAADYRNLGPLRALHAAGKVHYASVCQPRADFERAPMPVELARLAPDVLVMHAPVDNVRGQALLRYARYNPDVFRIYALDDLITHIPESNPTYRALPADAITERLELGLKASNRLIVSTEPLMHACRHLIDDIRLLPNSLPWSTWGQLQSKRRRGGKLRVGWAGAQQHAGDLSFMLEVVMATSKDVDWVFFGMLPDGARAHVAEFHDYMHDFSAYPAKLASLDLDLAVAPLEVHPFNEAKSNLRLLEYGVLGWPVICTDIFPYQTDNPPVTRLPNDPKRWIAAIRERVAEPDAMAAEGDLLREWVKKHYLLEQRLDQWFDAYLPESSNYR